MRFCTSASERDDSLPLVVLASVLCRISGMADEDSVGWKEKEKEFMSEKLYVIVLNFELQAKKGFRDISSNRNF